MKKTTPLMVIFSVLLLSACTHISQEEAITITQEFVNTHVKFYINENETASTVSRAGISITDTELKENKWYVDMVVSSNRSGEIKSSDLVVVIDAKSGEVINWGKPN